jgi:hypothetical protein
MSTRPIAPLALALLAAPAAAGAQGPLNEYGNPERVKPAPTTPAITVRDLQIRLYQFADDSMQGRQVGRAGNMKGTDYIAAEVKRLGLVPAGDNGTYFQVLPYHLRKFTGHSRLTVDGNPFAWNADWVAVPGPRAPRPVSGVEVIFGGTQGDTTTQISAAQAAGKLVVLLPGRAEPGAGRGGRGGGGGFFGAQASTRFADAAAVATVDLDALTPAQRAALNEPTAATMSAAGRGGRGAGAAAQATDSLSLLKQQLAQLAPQATLRLTRDAAARLFKGRPIESLHPGAP